jgi:membrane-bound lytic murein transglycosylase A
MRGRRAMALAALMLGACSSAVTPPRASPSAPPPQVVPLASDVPVRQPVATVPLPAMPVASPPPEASTAIASGVVAGPAIETLPITAESASRALAAFRTSCQSLVARVDSSGLTRGEDWAAPCRAARDWAAADAIRFFAEQFETVQVGGGQAFATGYYEPEIAGARARAPGYETPIYGVPRDLVEADLGLFSDALKGKRVRGKVTGDRFVPYDDRAAIEGGALDGRAPVIGWAADPIEIFFLQVQGSGRLRLPDGGVMRIGYAGQNGRDYTGIGKLMRDRGLLGPGQASMQEIMAWLRAHPEEGRAIMRENKSFVFFMELTGPGPLGALGLPVTGQASVAVDPKFVPLGAPAFLSMDRADATGLWVAQDTGGAIRGANRFDTFWGAGDDARATAGGMSARGTAWLLLPRGTLARLQAAAPLAP